MHAYSRSSGERTRVPVAIFAASVLLAGGAATLMNNYEVDPPWWISFPSVGAFYGALLFYVTPATGENIATRPATLLVERDGAPKLVAGYYTGRGRVSTGQLEFTRQ